MTTVIDNSIRVEPEESRPTHHISLSDGTNKMGLVICDSKGNPKPKQITRTPVPRTALKTTSGNQKYSDFEPPWSPIAQEDWGGGRGKLDFDDDIARYFDAWRANTMFGEIFLGGQETYTTGNRDQDFLLPGNVSWYALTEENYIANKFAASANYSVVNIYLWVKRYGTPTEDLTVALCSDNAGVPGAVLQSKAIDTDDIEDIISEFYQFAITSQAIVSGTSYWVKVSVPDGDDDNYWSVAKNAEIGTTKESTDDTNWTSSIFDLYYRVTDIDLEYSTKFFTYKYAKYAIVNKGDAAPDLYMNGDRGVADSNVGALGTLIDGTKSWTVDEWIGCVVRVTGGVGSTEDKPWRLITDNDGTTLTVDGDWITQHDTTTEYVILGSDKWTTEGLVNHGDYNLTVDVTSILIVNNIVYFAQGDDVAIERMRWRQNAGAADYDFDTDGANKAVCLWTVLDSTDGLTIWKANNKDATSDISVAKEITIPAWGTDITFAAAITLKDGKGRINNGIEYGEDTKYPYLLREGSVFYITTDTPVEIPLKEMNSAAMYTNGRAALQHNVYLYFSFGNGLERFYNSIIDDVGANKDEGLPTLRQGKVSALAGYPGRLFECIDAGADGISCLLGNANISSDGSGWTEIYRAPVAGQRMWDISFQPIPGDTLDRLWIAVGDDFIWIPFPSGEVNPTNDTNSTFVHECAITLGYMYAGLYDIFKFYKSLKLFTENLSEDDGITIEADYQIDESNTWVTISDNFDESPMQEVSLLDTLGVNGKRLRLRLRLLTEDNNTTPIVKGLVLENVSRVPVKYAYAFSYRNYEKERNLLGEVDDFGSDERQVLLDRWATELTPLTMRSTRKQFDDKTVFIDPSILLPAKEVEEGYIERMSIIEV